MLHKVFVACKFQYRDGLECKCYICPFFSRIATGTDVPQEVRTLLIVPLQILVSVVQRTPFLLRNNFWPKR